MHPKTQQAFRERTNNPSMAGVMTPHFKCNCCHKFKRTAGRVKNNSGYACCDCAPSLKA